MTPALLKRSQYFSPPTTEHPHSSRNHYFDWEEYHRPLARMHHAYLHDWGIASGLAVTVTEGGQQIEVQPGVAIDGKGELIALSASGQADVSLTQPGETGQQIFAPFRLPTTGLTGEQRYLTIQFAERVRFGEGSGGKLEQTPWLRLQPTTGTGAYVDDGIAIILAIVTVADNGTVTLLAQDRALPQGRRTLATTASALHLRHSAATDGQIVERPAAWLAPLAGGGLQLNLAGTADRLLFQGQGEQAFAHFTVRATQSELQGALQVQGKLQIDQDVLVAGKLGIGTRAPTRALTIDGSAESYLNLRSTAGVQELLVGIDGNGGAIATQSKHDLHLGTGGKPQITLKANGNVGIGTVTPGATLAINSPGMAELRLDGNNGGYGLTLVSGDSPWLGTRTNHDLSIKASGAEVMRIQTQGNVGIGTSYPETKLDVRGVIRARDGVQFANGSIQQAAVSIQSGSISAEGNDWHRWGGRGVQFARPFLTPPTVFVAIAHFELSVRDDVFSGGGTHTYKLQAQATSITTHGFSLVLSRHDSRVKAVTAHWLAYVT